MLDYLLKEDGDALLQENGGFILLDRADGQYVWISDTSYTSKIRLDSFAFTEAANQGEVGVGGFNLDDDDLTVSVPALKPITVYDFRASTSRVFTGYVHTRTTQRGPNKVAGQRAWDVELLDLNTLADDYVFTSASADRPAETDYERITWLLGTSLNTLGGVTAGVVPNTNTVSMDAIDYRGRKPREVLDQCGEITGKNWFIYYHSSGPLLYYDLSTGTSLTSSAKISDVAADVDSATVWAPVGPPTVTRNPDEVYSAVNLTWAGGTVLVSNATTSTTYRVRQINLLDMGVRTSTTATAKANAFLAASATERTIVSDISVRLPAANVNDIRAGQRIQIKLARHGISAYTYYRVTRRVVVPLTGSGGASDVEYLVILSLIDTLAPTRYLYQRASNEVWEVKSNATQDGASVIVNRDGITVTGGAINVQNSSGTSILGSTGLSANTVGAAQITAGAITTSELNASAVIQLVTNDGATVVIDSSGIAVTEGAITVTNGDDVVIIDGSSDMFKIAATGTFDLAVAAPAVDLENVTLTGLGAWAYTPAHLALLSWTSSGNGFASGWIAGGSEAARYVASSSGGSPTSRTISHPRFASLQLVLDGSDQVKLTLTQWNYDPAGGTATAYCRYYVLIEAGI